MKGRRVGIIPVRFCSKRFLGKPLAFIRNRPLVVWSFLSVVKQIGLENTFVATDDNLIFSVIKDYGGNVLMTAQHHQSGTDRVAEAARLMGLEDEDTVINIQGDIPFLPNLLLDKMSEALDSNGQFSMVTSSFAGELTKREKKDQNVVKLIHRHCDGSVINFFRSIPEDISRSRFLFPQKHHGIYAFKNKTLQLFASLPPSHNEKETRLEQMRLMDNNHRIMTIPDDRIIIDVNVPSDIKVAESFLSHADGWGIRKEYSI